MTSLLLFLAVFLMIGIVYGLSYRHGVAPRWRPGEPQHIEIEDEPDAPGGFTTDFGPKRERLPTEADGPGWDS